MYVDLRCEPNVSMWTSIRLDLSVSRRVPCDRRSATVQRSTMRAEASFQKVAPWPAPTPSHAPVCVTKRVRAPERSLKCRFSTIGHARMVHQWGCELARRATVQPHRPRCVQVGGLVATAHWHRALSTCTVV